MPGWYQWDGPDLLLAVHLQPRARRDELAGTHGERLRIRITAAPVQGRANRHLIRFLAECFGVAARDVELLSGASGREKRLRIRQPRRLPPGVSPGH